MANKEKIIKILERELDAWLSHTILPEFSYREEAETLYDSIKEYLKEE